jgi:hypothetical protein
VLDSAGASQALAPALTSLNPCPSIFETSSFERTFLMKLHHIAVAMLGFAGCSLLSIQALAQEDELELSSSVENKAMTIVAADDESGGPPVVISAISSSVDGEAPVFTFSEPGAFFLGGAMTPMDPIGLLHNADVQKEIELDSNQLEEFKKANDEFQKLMQERGKQLRGGKLEPGKLKELAESMKQIKQEQTARMKEILIPQQLERLQQISTQQFMESAGAANALASKHLADQLGLTKEQIERLKKRSEEINKELREKMDALKLEAREQLLNELTSEQRDKINQLLGKKYTYKMPEIENLRKRLPFRQPKVD